MVIGSDKPELSDLSGFYTLLFLVCTLWVCISTVTSAIKLSNCRQELAEVSLIFHILQLPMATLLRVSSSPHQFCLRVSVKLECVSTNQHPEVRWKIKVSTYLISTFCVCVGVFCKFFFFYFIWKQQHIYKALLMFSNSERCAICYAYSETEAFEKYVTSCLYCTAACCSCNLLLLGHSAFIMHCMRYSSYVCTALSAS